MVEVLSVLIITDRTDQLIRMIRDQITIIRSIFFFFFQIGQFPYSNLKSFDTSYIYVILTAWMSIKVLQKKEKDDFKVGHPPACVHSRILISRSLSLKKNEAAILSIKDFPKYIDKLSQNGCKISHLVLRSRNIISPLLQLSAEA